MTWNKRLTEAREAKNIIKSAFAKLIEVSAPTVTEWENGGITNIDAMNLIKICDALHIRPHWLMTGKGPRSTDEYEVSDDRIAHVIEVMRTMEPYQIDQAVKIVDTIAEPALLRGTNNK